MSDKAKIRDLERRVRELEARPLMPTIIIQLSSPRPATTYPVVPYPWPAELHDPLRPTPIWYVDYNQLPRC